MDGMRRLLPLLLILTACGSSDPDFTDSCREKVDWLDSRLEPCQAGDTDACIDLQIEDFAYAWCYAIPGLRADVAPPGDPACYRPSHECIRDECYDLQPEDCLARYSTEAEQNECTDRRYPDFECLKNPPPDCIDIYHRCAGA